MKKLNLFFGAALAALVMMSCGSSKEVAQETKSPCGGCTSTTEVFRYVGQHVASSDRQMQQARSQAANAARSELAAMINATIKRVIDNYTSEYIQGDASDFRQRVQDIARTVVKQELTGTPVTCEAKEPGSQPGNVIVYACVELTGKSVLDGIANQIKNDEKLRTDFEYEKFKKVLDEEMSKIE